MKTLPSSCVIAGLMWATSCFGAEIDFSRDVRPILSDKCFRCHGPDDEKREADLRLDKRESALESGAIVPTDPGESELLRRITASDPEMMMPPPATQLKISAAEAEILKQWIESGGQYAEHWAFVSPQRPSTPELDDHDWARNEIDSFVLSKQQQHGLKPSAMADQVTLVRRLYLDLLGLPPSPEAVDRFVSDKRPEAYEQLVEELLRSAHFGEHWGRHWLDAARYADSDGYEKDKPRSVWFYRDWVVQAMNEDMPYDDFLVCQIAGDLLPNATQNDLVATGFLRNSMVNEEGGADPEQFRVEGMFDRIDAIGKAILGITTQCGQCHSHKYDPLSQREYYQMFAALNDIHEATATVFTRSQAKQRDEVQSNIQAVEAGIRKRVADWEQRLSQWASVEASRLVAWKTVVPTDRPYEGQKFRLLDDGSIISESYAPTRTSNTFSLKTTAKKITAFRLDALMHPQLPRGGPGRSIYGTGALSEFEVAIAPADAPDKRRTIKLVRAWSDVNPPHSDLPHTYRIKDAKADDRVTGPIEYAIDGDHKTAWSTDNGPGRRNIDRHAVFIPETPIEEEGEVLLSFTLRQLHGGWNSDDNQNYLLGRYRFSITDSDAVLDSQVPSTIEAILRVPEAGRTDQQVEELFRFWRTTVDDFAEENDHIEQLWKAYPETDSQLVVRGMANSRPSFVFHRGDFLNHGESVQPGAPAFLNAFPATSEPARLRLARWLASNDAPTTARVIVNRIWQAYFGRGIVTTPEDFGYQSAPPSHPELLDWLAVELMDNNWSLKHIHRLIVNSATYQQSSIITPQLQQHDPYNELLARGARLRVPAESVRDIALVASGLLETAIGGPPVYPPAPEFLFQPPASYGPKQWPTSASGEQYRRSLYVHRYRSVPYPALQVFDAPKGDAACVRRQRSNTPLQALVMLNEHQFVECARAMAARTLREADSSTDARLKYAHQLCVSRQPSAHELSVLQTLLQQQQQRIAEHEINVADLVGVSPDLYLQITGGSAEEFAPWIVVCRAILNLDETITRQ